MGNKIIGLTVSIEEANLIFKSLEASSQIITDLKMRLYNDGMRQIELLNKQREPESQQEQELIEKLAEEMPEEKETVVEEISQERGENNE